MHNTLCRYILRIAALLFFASAAGHANTQPTDSRLPLRIKFVGVPEGPILDNVKNSVDLYQLVASKNSATGTSVPNLARLRDRAVSQIALAVKPYGYYNAAVTGPEIDSKSSTWRFTISLGDPLIVQSLTVEINGDAASEPRFTKWRSAFPLNSGDILDQSLYEDAKRELLRFSRQIGYFDAAFTTQRLAIDTSNGIADVILIYDSGPRFKYGDISILWPENVQLTTYQEELIQGYIGLQKGGNFDERELINLQRALADSPLLENVSVRPKQESAFAGSVPIEISLELRKKHVFTASAGFGSDTGPRATLGYENRRINDLGHKLTGSIYISDERQNVFTNYRVPLRTGISDSVNLFASRANETSDARDSETTIAGLDIVRTRDNQQWSYGISYRDEEFGEEQDRLSVALLMPTANWQYILAKDDGSDKPVFKVSSSLRGAHDSLLSDLSFLQLALEAKSRYPFGRGRLLARTQIAGTLVQKSKTLPESLRYFVGGDYSIRGYAFESIGVQQQGGALIGGENKLTASVEYEHPLRNSLSVAVFVDTGDAFDNDLSLKTGAGIGLRYRLPFGAFRFDIASALDLPGNPNRLHITFGSDL